MGLLDGDIASAVYNALKDVMLDVTVTTVSTVNAVNPWEAPTETATNYSGKGMIEEYDSHSVDGQMVHAGDLKVIILADSISATPESGDRVSISGTTYNVIAVKTDPATATYTLQVRSISA